jgi:hypothetical protein
VKRDKPGSRGATRIIHMYGPPTAPDQIVSAQRAEKRRAADRSTKAKRTARRK